MLKDKVNKLGGNGMANENMDVKKGNFGFVEEIYPDVYKKLCEAEKKTYIDCSSAGQLVRDAFEIWAKALADEFGIKVTSKNGGNPVLSDYLYTLQKNDKLPKFDKNQRMVSYISVANKKEQTYWDALWRRFCNQCVHSEQKPDEPAVTCGNLETVFHVIYKAFRYEYVRKKGKEAAKKIPQFDTNIIPIGDNYVINSYTPLDKPVSNCVREFETCSYNETGRINKYGIVRMFKKGDIDEKLLLLRDQEAFSEAESEAGIQFDGNVQVDVLSKLSSDTSDYYVVIYKFSKKPSHLNDALLKGMDVNAKTELCKKITSILNSFHNLSTPIYHRNLSFDSIYVCKGKNEILEPTIIKLDCAKIASEEFGTVIANVQNMQTMIQQQKLLKYSAPEVRTLFQGGDARVNWEKADVFSLGVLFGDIFNGQIEPGVVPAMKLQRAGVNMSLVQLIDKMKNPNADLRPTTETIIQYFEEME